MAIPAKDQPDGLEIVLWDDAFTNDAVAMMCDEYGGDADRRSAEFSAFYDHPFQKHHALRLAAVHDGRAVGLQTLFRWPYRKGDIEFDVLQSGNSLIARDWRGRGLFGKMLARQDAFLDRKKTAFLTGFPVDASLGSFKRNGWHHVGDLEWRLLLLNPLAALFPRELASIATVFDQAAGPMQTRHRPDVFSLSSNQTFRDWRQASREAAIRLRFHYEEQAQSVRFDLKLEKRRNMPVLTIGGIESTNSDARLLMSALKALARFSRRAGIVVMAVCFNPKCSEPGLAAFLRRRICWKPSNRAHFIVKPVGNTDESLMDFENWRLFRNDIDTW